MRVAVFRGRLTLNQGSDKSIVLVDRLRSLGHEVLHTTAIARPDQVITDLLVRDFVSPNSLKTFKPQAIAIVIPSPEHEYFPRETIDAAVQAGGMIVYIGPANDSTGESPARRFLAERGFFFESITQGGPQPIRRWEGASIHLTVESQRKDQELPLEAFDGVYFLEVRTPFLLAGNQRQSSILEISGEEYCTWDGTPLPNGMGQIAAMRGTGGREILLTGDWFSASSLATLACNTQFIANILTQTTASGTLSYSEQRSVSNVTSVEQTQASIMVSASTQSRPFVDLLVGQLRERGIRVVVSCGDADLSDRIPGGLLAFVPIIDREFSARQGAEAHAAMNASNDDPDGFRLIPINFRKDFEPNQASGALHELAEWVWLPAHDSREWTRIFHLLVRALNRAVGRFRWRTKGKTCRVFVSYSFRDYELAAELRDRLVNIGMDVFFADETTLLNSALREELKRLIAECDVFIPVITAEYRASNWSFVEAEVATERSRRTAKPQIFLFPFKDERVPYWFNGFAIYRELGRLEEALTNR